MQYLSEMRHVLKKGDRGLPNAIKELGRCSGVSIPRGRIKYDILPIISDRRPRYTLDAATEDPSPDVRPAKG
jgi:hypothetical protein